MIKLLLGALLFLTLFSLSGSNVLANQVATATMIFLQIHPSPQANGRAGVYLPGAYNDPYAPILNPGAVGLMANDNILTTGLYAQKTKWLPRFNLPITYSSYAVNIGLKPQMIPEWRNDKIPISLGIGFNQTLLDQGNVAVRNELNEIIGYYHTWERCRGISLGLGMDYIVKGGIGLTSKHAFSELGLADAKVDLTDWGYILELPLVNAYNKCITGYILSNNSLKIELTPAFCYAKRNFSDKVSYVDTYGSDPTPRTAVAEVSLAAELIYPAFSFGDWRLLSIKTGSRGESDLFYKEENGYSHYLSGYFRDIGVWTDLILGHTNTNITKMKAREVELLEIFTWRCGRHEDHAGLVFNNTDGFSLRTAGLFKYLQCLNYPHLGAVEGFIINHLDFQYNYASEDAGAGHPLTGTKWHGVSISIR